MLTNWQKKSSLHAFAIMIFTDTWDRLTSFDLSLKKKASYLSASVTLIKL